MTIVRYDLTKLLGRIKERELTQNMVAQHLGITPTAMSNKVRGRSDFRAGEITRMSELLGIPIEATGEYFFRRR